MKEFEEKIDELLDWLAEMHSTKPKGWNDKMVTSKAKAKLKALFTEHSKQLESELVDALDNHKKTLDYIVKDGAPRNPTNYEVYLRKAIEVDGKIAQLKSNKGEDNE